MSLKDPMTRQQPTTDTKALAEKIPMPACIRALFCGLDECGRALWEIETMGLAGEESKITASGTDLPGLLAAALKDWPLPSMGVDQAVAAAVERVNERIKELARGGARAASRAHNPDDAGSIPAPAPKMSGGGGGQYTFASQDVALREAVEDFVYDRHVPEGGP